MKAYCIINYETLPVYRPIIAIVNKQSFEKICLWLLAMNEGNKDLVKQDILVTKEPLFRLMDLHERSRQKMKAVEKHAFKSKDIYGKLAPALLQVGITMEAKPEKNIFLMLAKSLILARGKSL